MKRVSVRTSLSMAAAIQVGIIVFTIGVALIRTDPGTGNQISAGIAWASVGAAIVAGAIIKGCMILRAEK